MTNTAEVAKVNMIQQQVRPWVVLDNQVLSVLDEIDRQDFVPDSYKGLAYADYQIPVCAGSTMFPPTVDRSIFHGCHCASAMSAASPS